MFRITYIKKRQPLILKSIKLISHVMMNSNPFLYYFINFIISCSVLFFTYTLLDWPLAAKLPLCLCLFIETSYVTHKIYITFDEMKKSPLQNDWIG